jgi:small subunit ribosomal protein S21
MLIIPVKEGESIDKALKKFKKKFERTQTMRQLRKRQSFTKPSVIASQGNDPCSLQADIADGRGVVHHPLERRKLHPMGLFAFFVRYGPLRYIRARLEPDRAECN